MGIYLYYLQKNTEEARSVRIQGGWVVGCQWSITNIGYDWCLQYNIRIVESGVVVLWDELREERVD